MREKVLVSIVFILASIAAVTGPLSFFSNGTYVAAKTVSAGESVNSVSSNCGTTADTLIFKSIPVVIPPVKFQGIPLVIPPVEFQGM